MTDARYFETARKAGVDCYDQSKGLKQLMGRYKTIAFEESAVTVAGLKRLKRSVPGVKWLGKTDLVESFRMIKGAEEIRIIKEAVQIASKSFEEFRKKVKVGRSEDELEWELLSICRKHGADSFSFPPIITFGKDRADIHHQKGPNRLKRGEAVLVDMGICRKGYITDMTRVVYLSPPSSFEQRIYSTVLAANQAAIQSIQVGARFSEIDQAARQVIEKGGYGKYFTHSTGHGTGVEVHEAPTVSVHSKETVKPGMVFTIEPGIYIPGKTGVRIEDMVYVNEKGGVEVLTNVDKKMV